MSLGKSTVLPLFPVTILEKQEPKKVREERDIRRITEHEEVDKRIPSYQSGQEPLF